MREIKFRYVFKRKEDGLINILEVDIVNLEKGHRVTTYFNPYWELIGRDQWTGSQDKTGCDLYENDIWGREGFVALVEFNFSAWNFKYLPSTNSIQYPNFYSNAHTGKKIGTIYENSDLMERAI